MFRHVFQHPQGCAVALVAGAVFSFTARCGEGIVCRGGCVLLTQYGVAEDFELRGGASLRVQTHGLVVVEAIEASGLMLTTAPRSGSVAGQEYLQQLVQIALAARRRAQVFGRDFQQFFALRRE